MNNLPHTVGYPAGVPSPMNNLPHTPQDERYPAGVPSPMNNLPHTPQDERYPAGVPSPMNNLPHRSPFANCHPPACYPPQGFSQAESDSEAEDETELAEDDAESVAEDEGVMAEVDNDSEESRRRGKGKKWIRRTAAKFKIVKQNIKVADRKVIGADHKLRRASRRLRQLKSRVLGKRQRGPRLLRRNTHCDITRSRQRISMLRGKYTVASCNKACNKNKQCVQFALGQKSFYKARCDLYRTTKCSFRNPHKWAFNIYKPTK